MKPSVLIVDDEFGLADITAEVLTALDYDARIAINGQRGLEALAVRPADVVLVDVMMPVMGGVEMIRAMRATPDFAAIPAILMTAMPEMIPRGADALQDHVLLKPFNRAQLLAALDRFVARPPRQ